MILTMTEQRVVMDTLIQESLILEAVLGRRRLRKDHGSLSLPILSERDDHKDLTVAISGAIVSLEERKSLMMMIFETSL